MYYLNGDLIEGIKFDIDNLTATFETYYVNPNKPKDYHGEDIIMVRTMMGNDNGDPVYIDTLLTNISMDRENKRFTYWIEYMNRESEVI